MSRYPRLASGHPAVMLMTPCRAGSTHTLYTAGVLNSAGVYGGWLPLTGQSDVYVARNVLLNEFMAQKDFDTAVFIDSDIGFTKADLEELLSNPQPLVIGAYPGRSPIITNLCMAANRTRPSIEELRKEKVSPIRLGPLGFAKIHRSVMQTIIDKGLVPTFGGGNKHHFFQSGIINDELASEDFVFCDLAGRAGFQVYATGRLNLNHDGYTFPVWKET